MFGLWRKSVIPHRKGAEKQAKDKAELYSSAELWQLKTPHPLKERY
jgi:hypothetical protein